MVKGIDPASPSTTVLSAPPQTSKTATPAKPYTASTICSLSPITFLGRCWSFFVSIISWFFCCCSRPDPQAVPIPKVDLGTLTRDDPFYQQVFNPDGSLLFPKTFEETVKLFQFLGATSYFSWIVNVLWLNKKEKEVKRLQSHPLVFLYYLLCTKEITKCVENLKDQAARGSWLLRLKAGRDPWEEFVRQQVHNMERRSDIHAILPGFCKSLNINEAKACRLAGEKKWEELVLFIFEERRSQF